jgi:tetratricopeptide (TPR) repeat protein
MSPVFFSTGGRIDRLQNSASATSIVRPDDPCGGVSVTPLQLLSTLLLACGLTFASLSASNAEAAKPRAHEAYLARAQALERARDWPALLDLSARWQAAEGTNVMARYVQGRALTELKRDPEAIGAYLEALRLDPEHVYSLNNLGNAYRRIGRFHDALLAYRQALRIAPDCVRAWHNIAVTYYGLKGQEGVDEALATVRRIDPKIAEIWLGLLREYARSGDEGKAMEAARVLGGQRPEVLDQIFETLIDRLDH